MNRKNLIIFFVAILFLIGACSLPFSALQNVPQTSNPQGGTSQPGTATQPPLFGGSGQSGTQTNMQQSIPVAPNSQMDSSNSGKLNDPSGSFTIHSQSTIDAVVGFYATELPKQGWTLRYSDANHSGGETQYWKTDNIYLSLDFGFDEGQLRIQGQYQRLDPKKAQMLPKDFTLPGQAEMVEAGTDSWEFYIPQDYADVTNFFTQQLSSQNWKEAPTPEPMEGGCGGSDCVATLTFPPGVTPMPTATIDPRQGNELSFTMPDGNEIGLTITPHQNGTILDVDETLKNLESARLPQDVPIYPGAVVQLLAPGMAGFQVNADMNTIKNYYLLQLTAAGWTLDISSEDSNGILENWVKGNQKVSIFISSSGASNLSISCSTCVP